MLENLTAESFEPYLGREFKPRDYEAGLTLVSVKKHDSEGWPEATRQPFTLVLTGPTGNVLVEGYHRLSVEGGPDFDLYVIPIHTMSRDRQDYQIAFN